MTPLQTIRLHEAAVRRIAKQIAMQTGRLGDREDLVQDGFVAVLEMKIDETLPERKRHAYVEQRVRGAMLDSLRNADPCPRSVRTTLRAAANAERALTAQLGRQPRDAEMARGAGIPLATYFEARRVAHSTTFAPPPDEGMDDYQTVDDLFVADHPTGEFADPAEIAETDELRDRLGAALGSLPTRYRELLVARLLYGYSFGEIAVDMGVTESRVCQLQKHAVERLREAFKV